MTVRLATVSEASAIAQIHVAAWRKAYRGQIPDSVLNALDVARRAEFWRERLAQEQGAVFTAWDQDCMVGFCDLIASRDEDIAGQKTAEIAAIYIAPESWRKGAGRGLCERALAEARNQGCAMVTLWVLAGNFAAQSFYQRMGFQPDGRSKMARVGGGVELAELRYRLFLEKIK